MLIRILSDLHLEFVDYEYKIPSLPDDQETTLILAGDCGLFKHVKYANWVQELSSRFHIVLLVAGNHEFYSGKMPTEQAKFENRIDCDNVHVLQNTSIEIDGVLFIGGTLWTSFRNGNPLIMMDGESFMNDYSKIRVASNGYRKLKALDILEEHTTTRNFIFDTLEKEKNNYEKIVVVTHHAPSMLSISDRFIGDKMNDLYVNNFEYWIENVGPTLWFHGHIHESMDYTIGDTRVICNPKGYSFVHHSTGVRTDENTNFDPTKTITI